MRQVRMAPFVFVLVGPACATKATPAATSGTRDPCTIASEAAPPPRSGDAIPVIITLQDWIDVSRAPRATNRAERFLFAQIYETLVRLDCRGHVTAGLAESWTRAPDGRGWVFTLREGERFHDGTVLTASDVASSWTTPPATAAPLASAIASIAVLGERVLRVDLNATADTAPVFFAQPALAVHKPHANRAWPYGTGPYHAPDSAPSRDQQFPRTVVLGPAEAGAPAGAQNTRAAPLEFRITTDPDPRNGLDAGADVLLTNDARTITYAESHASFWSVPMPWDLTYVLVTPRRAGSTTADSAGDDTLARSRLLREQLARDAVPGVARAAEPAWDDDQAIQCSGGSPPAGSRRESRIVYLRGDPVARGLAERLVALARSQTAQERWIVERLGGAGATARLVAAPLGKAELATALRNGAEHAYITSVPYQTGDPCTELGTNPGATITALVDTRPTAILRRGIGSVVIDGSGVLLFGRDEAAH